MRNPVRAMLAVPTAWVEAQIDGPLTDAVIDRWAAEYRCPRCQQIPRSLLAGCTDPICAAEAFRAELALERQIEASDD